MGKATTKYRLALIINIFALILSITILGLDVLVMPYPTIIGLLGLSLSLTFWKKIKKNLLPIIFALGLLPTHLIILHSIHHAPENIGNIFAYSLVTLATSVIYNKKKHIFSYLPISVLALLVVVVGNSVQEHLVSGWIFHAILCSMWGIMVAFRLPETFTFMDEDAVDYAYLMENLHEGVMFVDNTGKCVEVNKRWEEITGYSRDELINEEVTNMLLYPEDIVFMQQQSEERMKGTSNRYELRIKTKKEGDRWVLTLGSPLINKKGKVIGSMGIMTDLTQEKQMTLQLTNYAKELEKSYQKLKLSHNELEQFSSVVSHDLRSPISTINSFTQLLERKHGSSLNDEAKEYIQFIQSGCANAQNTIEGLLQLAKFGTRSMNKQNWPLEAILKDVLLNLNTPLQLSQARITTGKMVDVFGDRIQIVQLLQNIIENAIKYAKTDTPPQIHIDSEKNSSGSKISISDNGIGIKDEYRERIFWIFNQLDPASEGIGLGLATCKKIIDNHNGKLHLESKEGKGTSFHIFIPQS